MSCFSVSGWRRQEDDRSLLHWNGKGKWLKTSLYLFSSGVRFICRQTTSLQTSQIPQMFMGIRVLYVGHVWSEIYSLCLGNVPLIMHASAHDNGWDLYLIWQWSANSVPLVRARVPEPWSLKIGVSIWKKSIFDVENVAFAVCPRQNDQHWFDRNFSKRSKKPAEISCFFFVRGKNVIPCSRKLKLSRYEVRLSCGLKRTLLSNWCGSLCPRPIIDEVVLILCGSRMMKWETAPVQVQVNWFTPELQVRSITKTEVQKALLCAEKNVIGPGRRQNALHQAGEAKEKRKEHTLSP